MSNPFSTIQPTFIRYIASPEDAIFLVQTCPDSHFLLTPCRPNTQERQSVIKSGSSFVYEENVSGIKRWTDG